jgi:hypothetical protein
VDHRSRFSSLNPSFDDFLFAPVCDEANGMQLSVLSALARSNVDPWDEAIRLAAMPKAIAERTLLSILSMVAGKSWNPPEAQATAARLVGLLPHAVNGASAGATGAANSSIKSPMTSYWWAWVGFALMMSFIMPQHNATTANPDMAPSTMSEPAPVMRAPAPVKSSAVVPAKTAAPAPAQAPAPAATAIAPAQSENTFPDPIAISQ